MRVTGDDKPITARGDGLNAAPFRSSLIENPAERGDLDGQVGVLDHRPPPDGRHDLFFRDQFARPLDEHAQNIERAGADRQRNKNTVLVAPGQTLTVPIEAKFVEQENVGRGEHAHCLPVLPRVRAP